ncbi:MAG: methylated-DNA--[protein]-cysteine S-methyltransferase [Ectothiorhodospiraceae bacterium]
MTWTERGLCGVRFTDRGSRGTGGRTSVVIHHVDDGVPEAALDDICACLQSPAGALQQPLDESGTAFQYRVWAALRAIPPGTTRSYAAVARCLGRPTAARAVAAACAANPLAIATPCHRVVRRDGGLAGYRWGVWRKQILLARERESRADTADAGIGDG